VAADLAVVATLLVAGTSAEEVAAVAQAEELELVVRLTSTAEAWLSLIRAPITLQRRG
jgi:hypothetical protein